MAPLSITQAQYIATHTFTLDDVIGNFQGETYADNKAIVCGVDEAGSPPCPDDVPVIVEDGTKLYPIDSTFGFHVHDFEGADVKDLDGDYKEGCVQQEIHAVITSPTLSLSNIFFSI